MSGHNKSGFSVVCDASYSGAVHSVLFLLVHVVKERETGIKVGMYLMGMRRSAYWGSWYFTYAVISLVSSLLVVRLVSWGIQPATCCQCAHVSHG